MNQRVHLQLSVGVSVEPGRRGRRHSAKLELGLQLFHAGNTLRRRLCALYTWVSAAEP